MVDLVLLSEKGSSVTVDNTFKINEVKLVPALENFAKHREKRVSFAANFSVRHLGKTHVCQRCLSCYAVENEREETATARDPENRRRGAIYTDFDGAGIQYIKIFFD